MSFADKVFIDTCKDILQNGFWDTDLDVRPKWEDGTPAHTVKKFGVVNRYDLSKEFPAQTIRKTFIKSAVDELLWIWQKKSNNINDLGSHVWDPGLMKTVQSVKHTAINSVLNIIIKKGIWIRLTE